MTKFFALATAAFIAGFATGALAEPAAPADYTLTIQDHKFDQAALDVPANKAFTLRVVNKDASAEEFESHSLKREKVVPANGEVTLKVGPLKAGEYKYVGEFHEETAHGVITAK